MSFLGINPLFKSIKRRYRTIGIHLGVWLFYIFFTNALLFFDNHDAKIRHQFLTYALYAGLFYTNVYGILSPHVEKKQYFRIFLYTLLAILVYMGCRYVLYTFIFPWLGMGSSNTLYYSMLKGFIPDSIWLASQSLMFSYGYWFALHLIKSERHRKDLALEMASLEREKNQAQLAFLRSQLNPHFLFNTLNFFFSDALKTSPRLADSILILANMMRTVTHLSEKTLVPAEQELDYIRNYIDLQHLRFQDSIHLSFHITGEEYAGQIMIPPLLLITLVENVFKYADLDDESFPARIEAVLSEEELSFRTLNKSKPNPNYLQGGLGLTNIINQLTILYKDKHYFEKSEDNGLFMVKINIFTK